VQRIASELDMANFEVETFSGNDKFFEACEKNYPPSLL